MSKYAKVGVAIVFLDDKNRVLLGHRVADDSWGLVGGKVDWCETFKETAIRESLEEVNLRPTELTYIGINNAIQKPLEQHITAFYHANVYEGIYEHNEPEKHYEWKMFDLHDLPKNLFLPFEQFLPTLKMYLIDNLE